MDPSFLRGVTSTFGGFGNSVADGTKPIADTAIKAHESVMDTVDLLTKVIEWAPYILAGIVVVKVIEMRKK